MAESIERTSNFNLIAVGLFSTLLYSITDVTQ